MLGEPGVRHLLGAWSAQLAFIAATRWGACPLWTFRPGVPCRGGRVWHGSDFFDCMDGLAMLHDIGARDAKMLVHQHDVYAADREDREVFWERLHDAVNEAAERGALPARVRQHGTAADPREQSSGGTPTFRLTF
jgi:hypothetical protein